MKKVLAFLGVLLLGVTVGAATGVKITAELKNQKISYNGNLSNQEVIAYKGSTYVPLRAFGNLVNIPVNYKDGVIYLGEDTNSIKYWEKDIKHMAVDQYTMYNYQYNGTVKRDNIGNQYINYLTLKQGLVDGYIQFPLKGEYKTFKAKFAVPEGEENKDSGIFEIYLDGKSVYSKNYSPSDMPEQIEIDITGAQKISFNINGMGRTAEIGLFNGQFIK